MNLVDILIAFLIVIVPVSFGVAIANKTSNIDLINACEKKYNVSDCKIIAIPEARGER